MKICFLSLAHGPADKRVVDKEAASLAAAGHDVLHICPDNVDDERQVESRPGVLTIVYPRPVGLRRRFMTMRRLYRMAARADADVYHCNEVDSWLVGCALKILHRKPIVFDVHEHYPSTFAESRFPKSLRPTVAVVVQACFRILLPLTDRVVLAKRSVAADFSGAERKIVLVQNFVSLAQARAAEKITVPRRKRSEPDSSVTAVHLGLISKVRGWPQMLDAMTMMKNTSLRLHVIGEFNDGSREEFEQRAKALGLSDRIVIDEWLPFEHAFAALLESDIGLIAFQPGIQNHVFALPHKLFDYMLARLAVIAPAFGEEVATIVRETDSGLLVDPADPADLAQALDTLVTDPALRTRCGDNGRAAVLARYNWESEFAKLERMYNEWAGEMAGRALNAV